MVCPNGVAEWLAYVGVFSAITYLSLIIGELVPKNLALRHAESIACAVAPMMTTLSRVAAPAVWLLDIRPRRCSGSFGRSSNARRRLPRKR